jgi:hypothetical protein
MGIGQLTVCYRLMVALILGRSVWMRGSDALLLRL